MNKLIFNIVVVATFMVSCNPSDTKDISILQGLSCEGMFWRSGWDSIEYNLMNESKCELPRDWLDYPNKMYKLYNSLYDTLYIWDAASNRKMTLDEYGRPLYIKGYDCTVSEMTLEYGKNQSILKHIKNNEIVEVDTIEENKFIQGAIEQNEIDESGKWTGRGYIRRGYGNGSFPNVDVYSWDILNNREGYLLINNYMKGELINSDSIVIKDGVWSEVYQIFHGYLKNERNYFYSYR